MYKLIIEDDEGKTTVVPLIRDEISIGRKEGNTIRLTERNVSRRHARIVRQNGAVYIEDLSSYNGIKVNGDRVTGRAAIGEGDRIQIGDYQLSVKLDRPDAKHPTEEATKEFTKQPPAPLQPVQTLPTPVVAPVSSVATVQTPVVPSPAPAPAPASEKPARLVVVSKNFAGQEFPLDKAAVVIGRTEENDVVINHRSISRHHAKVVREGGHYHIVDLQSANGVRVNGEEYGKVELRKLDKIDLGHVRLVFVPPGQEFDVRGKIENTEPPARRSGMALMLGFLFLLLGGGVAWYFYSGKLPVGGAQDLDGEAAKILVDVDNDLSNKRWGDAIEKAERVLKMSGITQSPRDAATRKKEQAEKEKRAQSYYDRFLVAGGSDKYDEAMQFHKEIPGDSVYHPLAQEQYDKLFQRFTEKHLDQARAAQAAGNCPEFQQHVQQVLDQNPTHRPARELKDRPCPEKEKTTVPAGAPRGHHPKGPRAGGTTEQPEKEPSEQPARPAEGTRFSETEVDEILKKAQDFYVNGDYQQAIDVARPVRTSSAGTRAWRIIGGAACQTKDSKLATDAYKHLDATNRQFVLYVCQRNGMQFQGNKFQVTE